MITVVNKKTHKPCAHDVYIGRPSCLGNPFAMKTEADRQLVCYQYQEHLNSALQFGENEIRQELRRIARLHAEGKTIHLVCWCAPLACHGDIIKREIEELVDSTEGLPF